MTFYYNSKKKLKDLISTIAISNDSDDEKNVKLGLQDGEIERLRNELEEQKILIEQLSKEGYNEKNFDSIIHDIEQAQEALSDAESSGDESIKSYSIDYADDMIEGTQQLIDDGYEKCIKMSNPENNYIVDVEEEVEYKIKDDVEEEDDAEAKKYIEDITNVSFRYLPPDENVISHIDYDAFLESFIETTKKPEFAMFTRLPINVLDGATQTKDKLKNFRMRYQGDEFDNSIIHDKNWTNKVENLVYDMNQYSPIGEYARKMSEIKLILDKDKTYGINDSLLIDIQNKAIEPINMRKYDINCLLERGCKHIKRNTVCILRESVLRQRNMNATIDLIEFYNDVKGKKEISHTQYPRTIEVPISLKKRIKNEIEKNYSTPVPIMVKNGDKINIFNINELIKHFEKGKSNKKYKGVQFDDDTIESILSKNKRKCAFCSDDINNIQLRTIYNHKQNGPMIVYFCSIDCFTDIDWKQKTLNKIIR